MSEQRGCGIPEGMSYFSDSWRQMCKQEHPGQRAPEERLCSHSALRILQIISWVLQLPLLLEKKLQEQSYLHVQTTNKMKAGGVNVTGQSHQPHTGSFLLTSASSTLKELQPKVVLEKPL